MGKPRVVETNQGIQGEMNVQIYDRMQRRLRDKGWIETKALIQSGIRSGHALEIGPGPGYLGLEWLKNTQNTQLTGVDISPDMIRTAEKNAEEYGLSDRTEYIQGSGAGIPLEDHLFDHVFSNGSLHEWESPLNTFSEIWRVLKPGGRLFISDMRRDMHMILKCLLWLNTRPVEVRPGLLTSIAAAYIPAELETMMKTTRFQNLKIQSNWIGLQIIAEKQL